MDPQNSIPSDVGTVLIGALGAVVSMQFIRGLTTWQKVLMVVTGTIFSVLFTIPIQELVDAPETWGNGIAFIVGLFGWSIVGSAIIALRKADWWALVMEVVRRLLGRSG